MHRPLCLAEMTHYLPGPMLSQLLDACNCHLHFSVTEVRLGQAWPRLGDILRPWYDRILEDIQGQAVLNAE